MLTALELAGFKSFAEKTRFDFPDGITVIVGPNGSGKSNVVDAIKWVLGAQSAKALRGKDMIDVIFKGSSSAGRKPSNSAEATLVFDNSEKQLPVDTEEVNVTRRVYRSGEGEYLINGQACRLKDIRNLFRGTGVGVDAYSLIEQGKVDRMLQASPKDRRVIFEEAAGISRFNAKKAEANRRLGRVDQNLTRLKDIVDEVHTRLSRLKSQASKAQRYREMTARLQEIRTRLGWTEFTSLNEKTEAIETRLQQFQADHDVKLVELQEAQTAAREAELELHKVASQCQDVEGRLQDAQQQIAVCQNQQQALKTRINDSQEEQARQAARLAILRSRAGSVIEEVASIESEVHRAQQKFEQAQAEAERAAAAAESLRRELAERNERQDSLRKQHVTFLREASDKSAEVAQSKNSLAEIAQAIQSLESKISEQSSLAAKARQTLELAASRLQEAESECLSATERLSERTKELESTREQFAKQQELNALVQGRLAGAAERLEILQQLEEHLDGVDSGARHVIDMAAQSSEPAFQTIHGLVAELINVEMDFAPLIDTALGTAANLLVLEDGQLVQLVRSGKLEIPGRLSLMRLDRIPTRRFGEKVQLDGVNGVVGRADRMVKCKPTFQPLMRYLLGTTWIVESLDVALGLGHFRGAGLRFITSAGELVESDGMLTLGAIQSASGLVARRSEIQKAKADIENLGSERDAAQAACVELAERIAALAPEVKELESQASHWTQELARLQTQQQSAVSQLDAIEVDASLFSTSLAKQLSRKAEVEPVIYAVSSAVEQLQTQILGVEAELLEHEKALEGRDWQLQEVSTAETSAKVEFARAEQRLESLRAALEQSRRGQSERQQAVDDAQSELSRLKERQQASELEVLTLTSELAEAYLVCEAEERQLDGLAVSAAELRSLRSSTSKQLDQANRTIEKITQHRETSELELQRYTESRQGLLKRFEEDYQIGFELLSAAELIEDADEIEAFDAEASQLRADIVSVGEINMAALAELDELQNRYDFLNNQYEDLEAAKESLQRIIQKINQDSRRMFTETLEIIRQNFQKLYRKSFGGGNADIILEEGDDVLECGIDIIATPPGKTALSNSLLSGGEKALTAVALLLAIFQYRPSPFCVLDEVDAPFDEANIGRFVNVLNEFLDWTKFIIVTHSKKTMTASTTLYGVTMQESGVSKQVAVRFEDVNEKGEIVKPETRRAA